MGFASLVHYNYGFGDPCPDCDGTTSGFHQSDSGSDMIDHVYGRIPCTTCHGTGIVNPFGKVADTIQDEKNEIKKKLWG